MPLGMSDLNTTKTVRDWYLYSFIDMLDFGRPKCCCGVVFILVRLRTPLLSQTFCARFSTDTVAWVTISN